MIQLAGHSVNDNIVVGEVTLPSRAGIDLSATVDRISDWGGDPGLYSLFLGAALAAASSADAATVRSLGAIAGWRSGVIDLREDALVHAAAGEPAAVSAALGLPLDALASFVLVQADDRFAWPGGQQLIASIGGFRGFGGSWITPPTRAIVVDDGRFAVATGQSELWSVHADVFGHRVSRLDELPQERPDARLDLQFSPDSYLVQLRRASA